MTKVVIGCAGSGKTTDIINEVCITTPSLIKSQKNNIKNVIQILCTNTNALMHMVDKFAEIHGIAFKQENTSNHYINTKRKIGISTIDAWVNHLLFDNKNIPQDDFNQKINHLISNDTFPISVKNISDPITHIFIDGAQDLNYLKTIFIKKIIRMYPSICFAIYGDVLQNVFYTDYHPLRTFETDCIDYRNVCYRCPPYHVHFLNHLAKDFYNMYEIPSIIPDNRNNIENIHKPFLFTHPSTTSPNKCHEISLYVYNLVETIGMSDATLEPDDVVIIMSKMTDNNVFKHLSIPINDAWRRVMETRGLSGSNRRNYYSLGKFKKGHTSAICIHNTLSREFKCVIVLGMTDKSIPKETDVDTSTEIVSQSLFYLTLTRSTKYLFIGMNYDSPSPYLRGIHTIPDMFYCAWTESDSGSLYDSLPRTTRPPQCNNCDYSVVSSYTGVFSRINVILDSINKLRNIVERGDPCVMDEMLNSIQMARYTDNEKLLSNREYMCVHTAFLNPSVNTSIAIFFDTSITWDEKEKIYPNSIWNSAILYNQMFRDYIPKLEVFIDYYYCQAPTPNLKPTYLPLNQV